MGRAQNASLATDVSKVRLLEREEAEVGKGVNIEAGGAGVRGFVVVGEGAVGEAVKVQKFVERDVLFCDWCWCRCWLWRSHHVLAPE